jgi:hypothetical protein
VAAEFPVFDNKKHRTHLQASPPHIRIDFGQSYCHWIYFFDTTPDGQSRAAMPKKTDGVQLFYYIGENEPASEDLWRFWGVVSRSPAKMIYDLGMRGQKVWYRMRWYNTQNETSAWSKEADAFIN